MKRNIWAVWVLFCSVECAVTLRADDYSQFDVLDSVDRTADLVRFQSGNCRPEWYTFADVVWLKRDDGNSAALAELRTQPFGPPPNGVLQGALSTGAADFGFEPGIRVGVGKKIDNCRAVELSYMGLNDWHGAGTISGGGGGNVLGSTIPFLNGTAPGLVPTSMTATFSSGIHSAELMVRQRRSPTTEFSGGIRYFHFNDAIGISGIAASGNLGAGSIKTDNNLIGFQVGGRETHRIRNFQVSMFGNAGVYLNFNEQTMRSGGPAATVNPIRTNGSDVSFAGIIDTGLTAKYHIAKHAWIQGGYQVMYLSQIATAGDQIDLFGAAASFPNAGAVSNATLLADVNNSGSLLLHGFFVGFVKEF